MREQTERNGLIDTSKITAVNVQAGDRILFGRHSCTDPNLDGNEYMVISEDEILGVLTNGAPDTQRIIGLPARVVNHAIETFGSEEVAERWLSSECGALNNEAPADVIANTGSDTEVQRILDCIDHGMIA